MNWSVAEAKAKLSEVLERAQTEPQVIESRGRPKAVVISADDYARLKASEEQARPSGLQEFLRRCEALREEGPLELEVAARALEADREVPFEDG